MAQGRYSRLYDLRGEFINLESLKYQGVWETGLQEKTHKGDLEEWPSPG